MKKKWYKLLVRQFEMRWDDIKILLIIGIPFGILLILMHDCFDFTHLH